MLAAMKKNLFRAPRQGLSETAGILGGCLTVLAGCALIAFGLYRYDDWFLSALLTAFGLNVLLRGTAELLPRGRARLAGWLRVGAMLETALVLLVLTIATIIHNL